MDIQPGVHFVHNGKDAAQPDAESGASRVHHFQHCIQGAHAARRFDKRAVADGAFDKAYGMDRSGLAGPAVPVLT